MLRFRSARGSQEPELFARVALNRLESTGKEADGKKALRQLGPGNGQRKTALRLSFADAASSSHPCLPLYRRARAQIAKLARRLAACW